jgi:invasion protein IalB
VQDQQRQVSVTVAVGRLAADQPWKLVAQVPVNLAVAQPARLMLDAEAAATLPFRTCLPLGCFGDGGAIFTDDDGIADVLRSIFRTLTAFALKPREAGAPSGEFCAPTSSPPPLSN